MQMSPVPPRDDARVRVPHWLRTALYAAGAAAGGFGGLLSLTLGGCDPRFEGAWCGGDLGRVAEGYVAGTVMLTLAFALAVRIGTRRWGPTLLAAALGLILSAWFVGHVEGLL